MRLPLPTQLESRDGTLLHDERMQNAVAEAGEGVSLRAGMRVLAAPGGTVPQGGMGFVLDGTPYVHLFWDDNPEDCTGIKTVWDSGTNYSEYSVVSYNGLDYWAMFDTEPGHPIAPAGEDESAVYWSRTPCNCSDTLPMSKVMSTTLSGLYDSEPALPPNTVDSLGASGSYCPSESYKFEGTSYLVAPIEGPAWDGYPSREYALWMACKGYTNDYTLHAEPRDSPPYTTAWKYNEPGGVLFVYPTGTQPYTLATPGTGIWAGNATPYEPTVSTKVWYYITSAVTRYYSTTP